MENKLHHPADEHLPDGTPLQEYGYQYPVQDCRSGICTPAYLFFNGYISPNQVNSHNAAGQCNGVCGVPADYKPAAAPLLPWGATSAPNAPAGTNFQSLWDTNTVWIPLSNGTVQRTTFNDNLHPWRNQYRNGPNQWFLDASAFKSVNIGERLTVRFSVDFFNVLNNPNNPTHGHFGRTAERTQLRQPLACDAAFVTLELVSVAVAGSVCLFAFLAAAQDLSTALGFTGCRTARRGCGNSVSHSSRQARRSGRKLLPRPRPLPSAASAGGGPVPRARYPAVTIQPRSVEASGTRASGGQCSETGFRRARTGMYLGRER